MACRLPARPLVGGRRLPHPPRRGRATGRHARRPPAGAAGGARRRSRPRAAPARSGGRAASARSFDAVHGGFGGAPKFPAPMTARVPAPLVAPIAATTPCSRMVTRTLDAMADGGINDQLGGGFARYSTDAHWLVPHFEKMLYDNALLAHAYLEGYRATADERYAARRARDARLHAGGAAHRRRAASHRRWMPTARGSRDASTSGATTSS